MANLKDLIVQGAAKIIGPLYANVIGDLTGTASKATADASGNNIASTYATKASLKTVATSGSYTDLTNKPTIPSAVTETTVSGWGFTKNTGTLTGVKMNGAAKTVTNGVVDLGTVITAHQDISGKADKSSLATVATSGSYADLTNKPTIPSAVTETTVSGWGFTKNTGTYSKPSTGIPKTDLASAVQTSLGKADTALQSITSSQVTTALGFTPYNATNPNGYTSNVGTVTKVNNTSPDANGNVSITIPTVNNATLTIQKNGTNVTTFTANASSNATANITVPTKVSELTNDSGFTANAGTITGIKMNGASKGTSGVVDLGTVLTAHQSLDGCVKTTGAQTVAGAKTFSDNAKFTGTNLTLQHQTEASVTQASANPKITFNNVDASQSASLIYNDFDSYEGSDSITMVSNQANPYFIAPHLRATNALHLGAAKTGPSIKYNTTEQVIEFTFA